MNFIPRISWIAVIILSCLIILPVKSRMVGVRLIENPGNKIVYSAGCTLPKNYALGVDQTAGILMREGPLYRSSLKLGSCYDIDPPVKRYNLTVVLTQFDKNCPPYPRVVGAYNFHYDAVILTNAGSADSDSGYSGPWQFSVYPCIISIGDADTITQIIANNDTSYTVRFGDTLPSNIFEQLFDWAGLAGGICTLIVAAVVGFFLALFALACLIPISYWIMKFLLRCVLAVLQFIIYSPVWVVEMGVATSVKIKKIWMELGTTCIGGWRRLRFHLSNRDPQATCSICLEDCTIQQNNTQVLGCNHIFHRNCIGEWLSRSASCPTCRHAVNERTPLLRA